MGLSRIWKQPSGHLHLPPASLPRPWAPPHSLGKPILCFDRGRRKTLSKTGKFSQMISIEVLLPCSEGRSYEVYSLMGFYVCTHACNHITRSTQGSLPAWQRAPPAPSTSAPLPHTEVSWLLLTFTLMESYSAPF